jgi:hypothetical protein
MFGSILCTSAPSLRRFAMPWGSNITEEKSCVFNEIAGVAILAPIVCWI